MQSLIDESISRTQMTHEMLLETTERLTETQFGWEPGTYAPPAGWHLWHMARWADRIQAAWNAHNGEADEEIWQREGIAARWKLEPATLGVLQTGMSMKPEDAVRLVQTVGQASLLDYARRAFAACDAVLDQNYTAEDFDTMRTSVNAYRITEQMTAVEAPPGQATIASEVLFHLHHGTRHLGMIEGIVGAQGINGTASI